MYFAGNTAVHTEQLAHSKEGSLNFPVRVPLERLLTKLQSDGEPSPQIDIVASGSKFILISIDGVVYGMGANQSRQMGTNMPPSVKYFRDLQLKSVLGPNNAVVQIACGKKHTLLLTEKGEVYSAGDNTFMQLGRSSRHTDWALVRVGGAKVRAIACGPDTSFALTVDGSVYSWGRSEFHNLGHPGEMYENEDPITLLPVCTPIDAPTRIEAFHSRHLKIVEIAVGDEHFVARTEEEVFTCGTNTFGRLGLGDTNDRHIPHRVTFSDRKQKEKLIQISAGSAHTIVTRHNQDFGTITYIFGREGSSVDGTITPRLIQEAPLDVKRVFCGWGSSSVMAVTEEGSLYNWGAMTHCPAMMLLNDAVRKLPSRVVLLDHVKLKLCSNTGGCFMIACADVAASPKAALLEDVVVPYELRLSKTHFSAVSQDLYDQTRNAFLKEFLGGADGAAYIATLRTPPPPPEVEKPSIVKGGTAALNLGSKVRLWMQDVYAIGKITNLDPLATGDMPPGTPKKSLLSESTPPPSPLLLASKRPREASQNESAFLQGSSLTKLAEAPKRHHFEVTWARDDWAPEIVELFSDDETLDEENSNRWQKVWFLEPPEGVSAMKE